MKKEKSLSKGLIFGMRKSKSLMLLSALAAGCCAAVIFVARAYNAPSPHSTKSTNAQSSGASRMHGRLARNPQADRFRRLVGQRFLTAGRESTTLTGSLLFNGQTHAINIVRLQDDGDEGVSVALSGAAQLSWNGADGAMQAGSSATGDNRKMVERIALDSPDQFVLAQLRAASYKTMAQNVVPAGASDQEDYSGPVWDVVRVGEPNESETKQLSPSRLYYINTSTGLIDRVVSQESGETITAEFSTWVEQGGEKIPTRVVWRKDGATIMELNLTAAAHSPRQ